MKSFIRWVFVVVLVVAAMAIWQGGRMVFAEVRDTASTVAANDGDTAATVKKTLDDYLIVVYIAFSSLVRNQVSLEDFIACNRSIKWVSSYKPEQLNGVDYGRLIEHLKTVDFFGSIVA